MLQRWLFFSSIQRETASSTIQAMDFHACDLSWEW